MLGPKFALSMLYRYVGVPPTALNVTVDILGVLPVVHTNAVADADNITCVGWPTTTVALALQPLPEFTVMVYGPALKLVNTLLG